MREEDDRQFMLLQVPDQSTHHSLSRECSMQIPFRDPIPTEDFASMC